MGLSPSLLVTDASVDRATDSWFHSLMFCLSQQLPCWILVFWYIASEKLVFAFFGMFFLCIFDDEKTYKIVHLFTIDTERSNGNTYIV